MRSNYHKHFPMTVRLARAEDHAAIERLATLDSARAPGGELLVAERDARLLAALPLGSGAPIADPFEPTVEMVALLEVRRTQLVSARERRARRFGDRVRALVRARQLLPRG